MKKSVLIAGLVILVTAGAALAIGSFASDGEGEATWRWYYKMIVEIDTPEGVKSGEAVRAVEIVKKRTSQRFTDKKHYVFDKSVKGEAVVVDLGERGVLFALTDWNDYMDAVNAFGIKEYEKVAELPPGSKAVLDPQKYPGGPKMVTFTDMDDPKSVKLALSWSKQGCDESGCYKVTDNLEELFGEGVTLKNIIIEITDEPVTWGGVDAWLPDSFWQKYGEWMKSMDIYERGKTLSYGKSYFKKGEAQ